QHFFTKTSGSKAKVAFDLLDLQGREHPVLYNMVQNDGEWKINSLQVMPPLKEEPVVTAPEAEDSSRELYSALQRFLNLLQKEHAQSAYKEYLAAPFKDAVTLEQFQETLKEFPQMTQFEALDMGDISEEGGLKHLTVMALFGPYFSSLEFWLAPEGGEWKIWAIEVDSWQEESKVAAEAPGGSEEVEEIETEEETSAPVKMEVAFDEDLETYDTDIPGGDDFDVDPDLPSDPELLKEIAALAAEIEEEPAAPQAVETPSENVQLQKIIQDQLALIKEGKIEQAYNDFTADEFKQVTSLPDFEKFVKNYPELTNYTKILFIEEIAQEKLRLVKAILDSEKGESRVDFWLAPVENSWKIFGIRIDESAYYPPIDDTEKALLLNVIKDQLKAIRDGDLSKAYYGFASQEFQTNTPFDAFKQFIESYPIFGAQNRIIVGSSVKEGNLRLMRLALSSMEETAEVDYRLVNEDGKWKIWGMQILASTQTAPEDVDAIKALINEQFDAFRAKDPSKAYYAFTSRQFQEAASPEMFERYLEKEDELTNNASISVQDISFKNNLADALVVAKSQKGTEKAYNYRFIYENNQWKILGIRVHIPVKPAGRPSLMQIEKIDIGTKIDLQGKLTGTGTLFTPEDKELTVNVSVKNALPNDSVAVKLEHVDSASSIEPVTASVDKQGNAVLKYVFTAPTQGWPTGLYILHAEGSNGSYQFLEFTVEEKKK
ncbi:MAG: DUF4864 domain-containing protein, partial [Chlamydiia bacterium]|nr:DUF4864 domain-containing protein [Chlamydiia bacterium]